MNGCCCVQLQRRYAYENTIFSGGSRNCCWNRNRGRDRNRRYRNRGRGVPWRRRASAVARTPDRARDGRPGSWPAPWPDMARGGLRAPGRVSRRARDTVRVSRRPPGTARVSRPARRSVGQRWPAPLWWRARCWCVRSCGPRPTDRSWTDRPTRCVRRTRSPSPTGPVCPVSFPSAFQRWPRWPSRRRRRLRTRWHSPKTTSRSVQQ